MPKTSTAAMAICAIGTCAAMALLACTATPPDTAGSSTTSSPTRSTAKPATTTIGSGPSATSLADPDGTAGTTGTSTAPPRFTAEEQAVADAYVAAMDAINQAAAYPPDPNHPALFKTMVGALLMAVQEQTKKLGEAAQTVALPNPTQWRVEILSVQLESDTASVRACIHDDARVINVTTGSIANANVSTSLDEAQMLRVDGDWKATGRQQVEKWEGIRSCALPSS